jgi:hypothetical protein
MFVIFRALIQNCPFHRPYAVFCGLGAATKAHANGGLGRGTLWIDPAATLFCWTSRLLLIRLVLSIKF